MDAIRKIRLGDEELRLWQDISPDSPRNWDNLGRMVCFHTRYELGDKSDIVPKDEGFESWGDLEDHLYKKEKAIIVIPLYLYDHSGITMRTYPFGGVYGRFDSGQVGFIYAIGEDIRKEYGIKRISKRVLKDVEASLKNEVATYDQYLRGDIYGFVLVKLVECPNCENVAEEDLNSCWGFYGDSFEENGMLDSLNKKWKDVVGSSVYDD